MRIIGGRDYYDSAMAYGQDKTVMFVRHKEKTIGYDEIQPIPRRCQHLDDDYYYNLSESYTPLHSVHVCFCGRCYCGVAVGGLYVPPSEVVSKSNKFGRHVYWDADSFLEAVGGVKDESNQRFKRSVKYIEDGVREYFADSGHERYRDRLIELGITIAVRETSRSWSEMLPWKIDGCDLRIEEFFRVKDPVTAYQEISMWVGGVLVSSRVPPPQIVNEGVRIEKRGFDSKTSFRREKTKKS